MTEQLPRLERVVARDHAAALHHVDQPAGPRVADAQAPLQHGGRGAAHLDHGGHGVAQQVVLVGVVVAVGGALLLHRVRGLEQLLLQLGLALAAPVARDLLDLLLGDERALDARGARSPAGRKSSPPARAATRPRSGRGSRASRSARRRRRQSAPARWP